MRYINIFTLLLFCLLIDFSTSLQAQSRQIWTETFPSAAAALEAATQEIPNAYELTELRREQLGNEREIIRYELQLHDRAVFGKQIVVAEGARGYYRAAYPYLLPKPGSLKLQINDAVWRRQLNDLLNRDDHVYHQHSYGIVPAAFDFDRKDFELAVIIDTEVAGSHRHDRIYLNAATGKLIGRHSVDCTFVPGTAETLNHGTQTIETTADGPDGTFRLYDESRGDGIHTVGASGEDLYDDDNDWAYDDVRLSMALDVHFGMGSMHDFLKDRFSRNGLDNAGVAIQSTTGQEFANAFYGGPLDMGFGAGAAGSDLDLPLSAIDIVGHEMAHGVTAFMNGLIYDDESGGLNEAFSDIMGVTLENDYVPAEEGFAWIIGEQVSTSGFFIRNMADPNVKQMPDTYEGDFWIPNLEVHSGSSIANFWYYLLVAGSSGTNDVGYEYNVPALGYDKAVNIVYNGFAMLMPSSNYADCSVATILAAGNLYGVCSPEVQAVEEAWRAVNVLAGVAGIGTTDVARSCEEGETITFNAEIPGNFIDWNFGDGQVSNENPATHQYAEDGNYQPYFRFTNCAGDTVSTDAARDIDILTATPEACQFTEMDRDYQELDDCLGQITDDGGEEEDYSNDVLHELRLVNPDVGAYRFSFSSMNLEAGYDYLLFYNGDDEEPVQFFTGSEIPEDFEINSNNVRIVFSTDGSVIAPGFVLSFECLQATAAPTTRFDVPNGLECRGERTYTSTSLEYPNTYNWTINGDFYGEENELTVNWADLGAGSYELGLEACNDFGCDTYTETILITDEVGQCAETTLETGLVEIQGCGSGILLDDGGRDGEYSNGVNARVTLSNEAGNHYRLNFRELDLEATYDYLWVYDNTDPDNPVVLEVYSGFYAPFEIVFSTSSLLLEFTTDGSVTEAGFEIDYTCELPNATTDLLDEVDWQVFPNPFRGSIQISGLPAQTNWTLQLFAADGRLVSSRKLDSGRERAELNASGLPAGMYWLRAISQEGALVARRLVKE